MSVHFDLSQGSSLTWGLLYCAVSVYFDPSQGSSLTWGLLYCAVSMHFDPSQGSSLTWGLLYDVMCSFIQEARQCVKDNTVTCTRAQVLVAEETILERQYYFSIPTLTCSGTEVGYSRFP